MNPDVPTKEELDQYRRWVKNWLKRKNLNKAIIRFAGEYLQIFNKKPDCINKKLRKALGQTPQLEGWRKEIWINLKKTIFRNCHVNSGNNKYFDYGEAVARLDNLLFGLEKIQQSTPGGPSSNSFLKPYLPLDKNEKMEITKAQRLFIEKFVEAENQRRDLSPSQKEQIALGEAKGARAIYNDDGQFFHATDATKVYYMMLLLGDYIELLPSRAKIFQFLKIVLGTDMPHDEEAFVALCKRIELKGVKGREKDENNIKGHVQIPMSPDG